MSEAKAITLEHRGLLRVGGADRIEFLQGIVSNDVARVTAAQSLWSAFLTPQGKFLHEFFLIAEGDSLLLDCEAPRSADLARRLKLYKLRSQVTVEDATAAFVSVALIGEDVLSRLDLPPEPGATRSFGGGFVFTDPRLAALGARAVLPRDGATQVLADAGFAEGSLEDYDRLRIAAGVPDGSRDLEVEKSTLLESGFDELHGVDWDKGCYMGQELTARTKYRALIKKRLMPVEIDGPLPESGSAVTRDGKNAGVLRSGVATEGGKTLGLALIRLDALGEGLDGPLMIGDAQATAQKPDWADF